MRSVYFRNSGTTEIPWACPVLADKWGRDPYVWRHPVSGHEFVVATTATHRETGCCDMWEQRQIP
jgi:hypothetical protein